MHDILDILGVPDDASGSEVRRACARRPRRLHPDFGAPVDVAAAPSAVDDVAIDFLDIAVFIERMQAAFFAGDR